MTPVDRHVGRRIRGKRRALGLSEAALAKALDIEPHQVEVYERAVERVPAELLARLSKFMGVPLSYFFPTTGCSEA